MSPTTSTKLLDCTLRDGGYYNDWDFSSELIQDYLYAMAFAHVDVVELGFRRRPADRYLGPTAYTTDRVISMFDVPDELRLGVMVDAKEVLSDGGGFDVVDDLFGPSEASRVDLIRIAAHHREIAGLGPAIARMQALGYGVGVNLMQISERTADELAEFGRRAREWGVEVAYVADSFGSLRPADLQRIISDIRSTFDGPLGCHMHDNMGMALANTAAAMDHGATWVDGTLLGMGRGPGNAKTEYLAVDLARAGSHVDHVPLLDLVTKQFGDLQREYGWGSNIYYFLSAAYGIHPSYVHEMMRDGRYGIDEIVMALTQLQGGRGHAFTPERLATAVTPSTGSQKATGADISGWCEHREVLIVGAGPSSSSRRADIERFVRDRAPLVVGLNVQPPIDDALVDAFVVCHPVRALIDADVTSKLRRPVFIPPTVTTLIKPSPDVDVREFGLVVMSGVFEFDGAGCRIPRFEAAAYALAVAAAGGAHRILLAGFDGFKPGDVRQEAMVEIFERYGDIPAAPVVTALTPTSYPVKQSSIFAEL